MSNSDLDLVQEFLDDTAGSTGFTASAIADILELSVATVDAALRELQRDGRVTAHATGDVTLWVSKERRLTNESQKVL